MSRFELGINDQYGSGFWAKGPNALSDWISGRAVAHALLLGGQLADQGASMQFMEYQL